MQRKTLNCFWNWLYYRKSELILWYRKYFSSGGTIGIHWWDTWEKPDNYLFIFNLTMDLNCFCNVKACLYIKKIIINEWIYLLIILGFHTRIWSTYYDLQEASAMCRKNSPGNKGEQILSSEICMKYEVYYFLFTNTFVFQDICSRFVI